MNRPSPFHVRIVQPTQVLELLRVLATPGQTTISESDLAARCSFRVSEPLLTLCDGMFGDGRVTKRDIRDFLLNNVSDAIWFDVIEQIEAFQQEIDM